MERGCRGLMLIASKAIKVTSDIMTCRKFYRMCEDGGHDANHDLAVKSDAYLQHAIDESQRLDKLIEDVAAYIRNGGLNAKFSVEFHTLDNEYIASTYTKDNDGNVDVKVTLPKTLYDNINTNNAFLLKKYTITEVMHVLCRGIFGVIEEVCRVTLIGAREADTPDDNKLINALLDLRKYLTMVLVQAITATSLLDKPFAEEFAKKQDTFAAHFQEGFMRTISDNPVLGKQFSVLE